MGRWAVVAEGKDSLGKKVKVKRVFITGSTEDARRIFRDTVFPAGRYIKITDWNFILIQEVK